MDKLLRQVGRAQRRLVAGQFLASLAWCWLLGLLVAAAWIATHRLLLSGSAESLVTEGLWIAASLALGFLAAVAWAWWTTPSRMAAAMEIDRRFHLEQRVSSALALSSGEHGSDAAEALVHDAAEAAGRVAVAEAFPLGHGRCWWLTLAAGVALLAVVLAIPTRQDDVESVPEEVVQASPAVREWSKSFQRELVVHAKIADQRGMRATAALFKELQGEARLLASEPRREHALSKLNDLTRQLDERRRQLAGVQEFQPKLERFGDVRTGPAADLSRSLHRSDFAQAANELENLQTDLAASKLDASRRDALVKNLEKLQAAAHGVTAANPTEQVELKQRAADLRRMGQNDKAATLEAHRERLARQAAALRPLDEFAEKIGQSLESIRKGDDGGATEMLGRARADLRRIDEQSDESRMLDSALDQIAQLRRQMNCDACGGKGCSQCQAEQSGETHTEGSRVAEPGSRAGDQIGKLLGEKTDIGGQFHDARVAPDPIQDARAASISGDIDGLNAVGASRQSAQTPTGVMGRGTTDPLSARYLPWKQADHAREYFERFRADR